MVNKKLRKILEEGTILFDNPSYDNSIIGITTTGRLVYSYEDMVNEYMMDNSCTLEEASDFVSYNTCRAAEYEPNGPIVMLEMYME